jgi:hypothetical protein
MNNQIGKGIAMAALCLSAAWLEINGKPAGGLWFLFILWLLFGEWGRG